MGAGELTRARKAMRFEIRLEKKENNSSTNKQCAISVSKRKWKGMFSSMPLPYSLTTGV